MVVDFLAQPLALAAGLDVGWAGTTWMGLADDHGGVGLEGCLVGRGLPGRGTVHCLN